jgi:general secretion pathway protein E
MGVEPFLIASSVLAMVAQRLVRVVCRECRQPYTPSPGELETLGLTRIEPTDTFYRATGCPSCSGTGYAGRQAIYELLVVDDSVRELVMRNADAGQIKKAALARNMRTPSRGRCPEDPPRRHHRRGGDAGDPGGR